MGAAKMKFKATPGGGGGQTEQKTCSPPHRIHMAQTQAKFLHCVHTAHAEAGVLTQEYLSPV